MIKKILEILIYLTAFLLPIQTRWIIHSGVLNGAYFEYGTISLYAIDILILLMLLFVFGDFFIKRFKGPHVKDYWWLLAVLEFSVFVSIIFSLDKLIAIYGYLRFLIGLALFYLILNLNYSRIKLIYSFLTGVLIQAFLGIWQFLTQSSFSTKWLGIAVHDPATLGTSVVETQGGVRWLRAYGGLDHPNMLGGLMVIGLFFVILLLIEQGEVKKNNKFLNLMTRWKVFDLYPLKKYKPAFNIRDYFTINFLALIAYYFLLVIFFVTLIFTFSRGSWIAFLGGFLAILLASIYRRDLFIQKKLLKVVLVVGVLIFILFNIYGDLAQTRVSAQTRLEIKSNIERMESYQSAEEILNNNWFFGVGVGNYPLAVEKYVLGGQPAYYYQPVHNVFLLVWSEIGIIGLIFFASFLFFVSYVLSKNLKNKKNKDIYLISILIAVLVSSLFDHWWWSLHFGILLFWFILAFLLNEENY